MWNAFDFPVMKGIKRAKKEGDESTSPRGDTLEGVGIRGSRGLVGGVARV